MTYDKIKELITINKRIILKSLDKDMEDLKGEYISDIKDNWIVEGSIGSFFSYLEYYLDEYIDFALTCYLIELIKQICKLQNSEMEVLSEDCKYKLVLEFINYFKNNIKIK